MIEWTTYGDNGENKLVVARIFSVGIDQNVTKYVNELVKGRVEIEGETADLSFHNFQIEDEGVYRCDWTNKHSPPVRLKLYGLYTRYVCG